MIIMVGPPARERRGASYAISAVIITATTVVLVLVASNFAYQNLERQRGAAEFAIAKKAILAFDEALENIAWKPQSSRSTRFVANYGAVELVPNALNLTVTARVGTNSNSTSILTGLIRYYTKIDYVNFGNNYKEYILGDERTVVSRSTEGFGQAVIEQRSKWVNITLNYRVCAMKTSEDQNLTYVDIWIIKADISKWSSYVREFDLKAKCTSVTTTLSVQYNVTQGTTATVSAQFGDGPIYSWTTPPLKEGSVVFNFIVADVEVSV